MRKKNADIVHLFTKMNFFKFPSIEQFRHTVKAVTSKTRYRGKDANGDSLYDKDAPLPSLQFTGTVKLHGSNAAVGVHFATGDIWAQSRNNILTAQSTNCGFWDFVHSNADALKALCARVPHQNTDSVLLYGEWVGEKIQRGVAICQVSRRFVLFAGKIVHDDSTEEWLPKSTISTLNDHDASVYNVHDYQTWTLDIDFNDPNVASEQLERITEQVEKECPVAKAFGVCGTGEGVVWTSLTSQYGLLQFKVKGEKHRVTEKKRAAAAQVEASVDVRDFVRKTVTENRLQQALGEVFGDKNEPRMSKTRAFIEWVKSDVLKEEADTLAASGLTARDVVRPISDAARFWLKKKCQ